MKEKKKLGNVLYLIPQENDFGGIQTFANQLYFFLRTRIKIEKISFNYLFLRGLKRELVNLSPETFAKMILTEKDFGLSRKQLSLIMKADLIHYWHFDPAILALNKKFIVSLHGLDILPKMTKYLGNSYLPLVISRAAAIHVPSLSSKKVIKRSYHCTNSLIVKIPPPVDHSKFKFKKFNPKRTIPVIGTLSRLVREKNVLKLIDALIYLKNNLNTNFEFILAGDGPERVKILKKLKTVNFYWQYLGAISNEDKIEKFYKQIDLFVLLPIEDDYYVEGFGIVYVEANACGVPVLASKSGGSSEAVKLNVSGLFVDPHDQVKIALKIKKMIEHRPISPQKAEEWSQKFNLEDTSSQFIELYNKLV